MKLANVTIGLIWAAMLLPTPNAHAQAVATASSPGSNIVAGGGVSIFNTAYGNNDMAGGFFFVDTNPQWRVGFEAEGRFLHWHSSEQVTEANYLGGVRVELWPKPVRFSPYAKLLAGAGEISLPFRYAHGGFLTYAPGAGIDIALNDRISLRAIDFEYQHWPAFSYGALSPYGLSAGMSVRLNRMSRFPKGARFRR